MHKVYIDEQSPQNSQDTLKEEKGKIAFPTSIIIIKEVKHL